MQYGVSFLPPGGAQMGISHGQHLPDLSSGLLPLYLFQLGSIATAFPLYPQTLPPTHTHKRVVHRIILTIPQTVSASLDQ